MSGFDSMGQRVRRRVRDDGTVVDIREASGEPTIELEGGKVVSLSPPRVKLRTGETVDVDGYVKTGAAPSVGAVVGVLRKGSFVLLIGEVVLL